ncbi:BREX-1 system adenine-specific DNA-methyltransferase PglX [Fluoribacter gormanii]|uniref:BREX-1 system adenine-specific DNA-methyltransferase PglX n=1 Tax=Fluoribacter gormanii TaxID=464 RepID=UPI001040EFA9|nr:BREX-1 system adenine-specific DNA-methyltransferase PglX [Fluoribacter gormanii]
METAKLKKFAQFARRSLIEQVLAKSNFVLAENSAARRERVESVKRLEDAIKNHGKEQVIERVAYTWFNRFCALRFMDVNRYTRIGVVSPAEEQFQPEILAEAKMGHIDEEMVSSSDRNQIFALLNGKVPSRDPQGEAYRLLVVATCNFFHRAMPFLFQRIDDYTELLMPDDLLSAGSILAYIREAMTPADCKDVEVIGWLYQFYISEKKDEVFDGLKKNKKITPENIPAATQLFTPHWIVRYLVENSLGRLWLLNRPRSKLALKMDYYIKTEQEETDFLHIDKPEEIKICDPACGSGHMLTYAFDLLYAIYEEEGYEPSEIPEKILTYNLFGIEIDERAGELAAFALTMKARAKQRRFFNKGIKPNICVLENIHIDENELNDYKDFIGRDLFPSPLQTTLHQFNDVDNFGSLIRPKEADVEGILKIVESHQVSDLFLDNTHRGVMQALRQANYLGPKYHVVIANPPYLGSKGMNERLVAWARDNYTNSKFDLYAMFIERSLDLVQKHGIVAMITMQSWMFLSSFEALRSRLLEQSTLLSMAHLGSRAFDSIGGEVVSTTAFVLENEKRLDYKGGYLRLVAGISEAEKSKALREISMNLDCEGFYRVSAEDFRKIPGSPIAYWASNEVRTSFHDMKSLSEFFFSDGLTKTGNNDKYLRFHWEVNRVDACDFEKYRICVKGGDARDYSGNTDVIIKWTPDARNHYRNDLVARITPEYLWQTSGISWSKISSKRPTFRWFGDGMIAETAGPAIFLKDSSKEDIYWHALGFLASKVCWNILTTINPTLSFQTNDVLSLPFSLNSSIHTVLNTKELCKISQDDWDSYETSWNYKGLPLLNPNFHQSTLKATYQKLRDHWRDITLEMQSLIEKNNRIFIESYGLQYEFTPDVELNEITLICNPHYRYGNNKRMNEFEALLLADTMRELVSYAVGCMFGRYSLDKSGLILTNQGETIEDYLKKVTAPSFPPDNDNVIPLLDGDWFLDDITERFCKFLRIAFGEEHYEENLKFIEQALNIKRKRNYSIRDYFLGEFYSDHVKLYKKRPIYWLFSSPKGSFNALIYMHRYRPDTVSVVLNDYLREFRTKLTAHKNRLEAVSISASASQSEKTKALKEIEKTGKMIIELEEYERDVLYPLATKQVVIDLDDGVKVNYPKFGAALKYIKGLTDE